MKKRVLMISCDGLARGGVQSVMMSIVRNLSEDYVFDMVLFARNQNDYVEEFLSYGGKIFYLPDYEGKNNLRRRIDIYVRGNGKYKKIKNLIRKNGPYDIIHCNNGYEAGLCIRAAYECKIPIRITHAHTIHFPTGKWYRDLLDELYMLQINKYSTLRIGCSAEACDSFFKGYDNTVVNNAYDNKRFVFEQPRTKENSLVLLQVGSFSKIKNQIFSIHVLEELVKIDKNIKLWLVGFDAGFEYESAMKEEIKKKELEHNVVFYPADTDIPKLMRTADGFMFPSLQEGFGIAVIEAQAMGLTCYVSDTVPQRVNCGGCIFLPLAIGPEKWADMIFKKYSESKEEHDIWDCSAFSQETVMIEYKRIYEGLRICE